MRWLLPSGTLVVVLTAACGPTKPESRADAAVSASASVSVAPSNVPEPPPSAEPAPPPPAPAFVAAETPALAPDSAPGCVLEATTAAAYGGALPLRAHPLSTPFLRITAGAVRISWPATDGAPVATVVRPPFTVHGFAPENLAAHAARAFSLAGVLQTTPGSTFTLVGGGRGKVVPTLQTPLFTLRQPLEARACKDFALGVPKFENKPALPAAKVVKNAYLRAGVVPVSATATSPPVLDLSPALAGAAVTVLEESGDRVRFVLERDEGNVIAWAAAADLRTAPEAPPDLGLGGLGLIGHGAGSGHGGGSLLSYECDADVALYVDMTDASLEDRKRRPYARVGSIQKKHPFTLRTGRNGLGPVAGQRLEGVLFTGQGALAVAFVDVQGCRRTSPEKRGVKNDPYRDRY